MLKGKTWLEEAIVMEFGVLGKDQVFSQKEKKDRIT